LFATFDPEVAEVSGVRTGQTDLLLSLTLAATVTATMNVLGVTLIAAVLVIPAVIARLLTDSFSRMLLISVVVGTLSGFFGVYLSYYLNVSSGASVVLVSAAVFVVAFTVSGLRRRQLPQEAAPAHLG
jgi:manganese/iron transport system permease protein/iron/zinc/copper transport system permease protein